MEPTSAPTSTVSKTTPRDFFLWLGAVIGFYTSITSLIALFFEYINHSFPDALASYGDPYGGAVRFSMAALIVFVPVTILLMHLIRGIILKEAGKANIWVRRWALGLTLFIAALTVVIDLVTLVNTFLGGEITMRFGLKVLVVLVTASWAFFHTYLDRKGYWIQHGKRAAWEGAIVALAVFATIVAGFFIIGTPNDVRGLRYDDQKVNDLRSIQYQVIDYWRVKKALPESLDTLKDPLSDTSVPQDPQAHAPYRYEKTGPLSFTLCATFNKPTPDTAGKGTYPARDIAYSGPGGGAEENWQHGAGDVCFSRTIDPERYPPIPTPVPAAKGL